MALADETEQVAREVAEYLGMDPDAVVIAIDEAPDIFQAAPGAVSDGRAVFAHAFKASRTGR